MGMLKMGTVALDGTKIHANASRHSALSYEHAGKIEEQLKAEVADLMARAEAADAAEVADGMSIPDELARREARLAKLAEARAKIEARAKERFEREAAEHRAKLAAREAKAEAAGKKPGGKPPAPPVEGPQPKDQINLTDEDSRIMPVAGGGFDQCFNAQAVVAAESLLVIAVEVVQAPNDKQQIAPMLDKIAALPEQLGRPETLLADNGYFSEANVTLCAAANIEPLIAPGRQPHHQPLRERFAAAPPAPENPTPVEAMAYRLRTPQGKKLYALRKQTPEPVFGIIKSVMGFRQFLLRGLDNVRGEWSLVTMAWNIKRMYALSPGCAPLKPVANLIGRCAQTNAAAIMNSVATYRTICGRIDHFAQIETQSDRLLAARSPDSADDGCPQCSHATETFRRLRAIRNAVDETIASARSAYEFGPGSYTFEALNAALNLRRLMRLFGLDGDDEVSP